MEEAKKESSTGDMALDKLVFIRASCRGQLPVHLRWPWGCVSRVMTLVTELADGQNISRKKLFVKT